MGREKKDASKQANEKRKARRRFRRRKNQKSNDRRRRKTQARRGNLWFESTMDLGRKELILGRTGGSKV